MHTSTSNTSSTPSRPSTPALPQHQTSTQSTTNLILVEVKHEQATLTAIIDSGSTKTLIRSTSLSPSSLRLAKDQITDLGSWDPATPIQRSTKTITLVCTCNRVQLPLEAVLVDNLLVDVLIGMDTINRLAINIRGNPAGPRVFIGEDEVRVTGVFDGSVPLRLNKRITLPPLSATIVTAILDQSTPLFYEGNVAEVQIRSPYASTDFTSLHSINRLNHVNVVISNPYHHRLVMQENTLLGHATFETPEMVCAVFQDHKTREYIALATNSMPNDEDAPKTAVAIKLPPNLTHKQVERANAALVPFSRTLVSKLTIGGAADAPPHTIDTGDHRSIKLPPRSMNPLKAQATELEVQSMIERGIVVRHVGPWAAPVHMVKKKDGTWRFCIDYRALNSITVDDAWPLPRIQHIFDSLQGAKWFSVLDLASGYWQIKMDPESSNKAAFITPSGTYAPLVMPFGLKNAPAAFQRSISHILREHIGKFCAVYIDDMIVYSGSFEEHLEHIQIVLKTLQEASLQVRMDKCQWFTNEVDYLGYRITGNGLEPQNTKLDVIKNSTPPRDRSQLMTFLGTLGYYRQFVKEYSKIARPLNDLLKEGTKYVWETAQQTAFETLIHRMCDAAPLMFPFYDGRPFILDTDASNHGMGAVLSQVDNEGRERPISFWSASYATATQAGMHITDREMLAILRAVTYFKHHLDAASVHVRTDHQALVPIFASKELPHGHRGRWLSKLQQFSLKVHYRPGGKHQNADGCSREPFLKAQKSWELCLSCTHSITHDSAANSDHHTSSLQHHLPTSAEEFLNESHNWISLGYQEAMQAIELCFLTPALQDFDSSRDARLYAGGEGHTLKGWQDSDAQIQEMRKAMTNSLDKSVSVTIRKLSKHLTIDRDLVLYKGKYVVPTVLRSVIINEFHSSPLSGGHFGRHSTLLKISKRFWWPRMRKDIFRSIAQCQSCIRIKPSNRPTQGLLQPLPPTTRLFQRIGVDVVGPLEPTKGDNRYILVIIDYYSHWVEAIPIPQQTSKAITDIIVQHIVARYGCPEEILTDQGSNLLSGLAHDVYEAIRAKKLTTTPYHPQTNGLTERTNGILKGILSHFVNTARSDWDELLPFVLYVYHTTPSAALGNFSPFEILYGQKPRHPLDRMVIDYDRNPETTSDGFTSQTHKDIVNFRNHAKALLQEARRSAQANMKKQVDKHRQDVHFTPGDIVYKTIEYGALGPTSLSPRREGPYRVMPMLQGSGRNDRVNAYKVQLISDPSAKTETVNVSKLTRAMFSDVPQILSFIQEPDTLRDKDVKRSTPPEVKHTIPQSPLIAEDELRKILLVADSKDKRLRHIIMKLAAISKFAELHTDKVAQPVAMLRHFLEVAIEETHDLEEQCRASLLEWVDSCAAERSSKHDISRFKELLRVWIRKAATYFKLLIPNAISN